MALMGVAQHGVGLALFDHIDHQQLPRALASVGAAVPLADRLDDELAGREILALAGGVVGDAQVARLHIGIARKWMLVHRQHRAGRDLVTGDDDLRILLRQHDRLAARRRGGGGHRAGDDRLGSLSLRRPAFGMQRRNAEDSGGDNGNRRKAYHRKSPICRPVLRRINTTPAIRSAAPASRTGLAACFSSPNRPKWSRTSDAIIWPTTNKAMTVAAPSFGTRKIAMMMKTAPRAPPVHRYKQAPRATANDGSGSPDASASANTQARPTA